MPTIRLNARAIDASLTTESKQVDYFEREKRAALEMWAGHLESLIQGTWRGTDTAADPLDQSCLAD